MKRFLTVFIIILSFVVLSVSADDISNFAFNIVFDKEAVSYVRFLDDADREKASTISGVKFSLTAPDSTEPATSEEFWIDYRIYNGETVSLVFVPGNATSEDYDTTLGTMLVSEKGNGLNYNVAIDGVDKKISSFTSGNNDSDVSIDQRSIEIATAPIGDVDEPVNPLKVSMIVYPPKYIDPENNTETTGFVSGQYTGYAILTITSGGN